MRNGRNIRIFLQEMADWLTRPAVVFYLLPPVMFLLVTGTIIQKEIGLYDAHRLYFSSLLVWFGPVPFPGVYPLVAVIAFSLFVRFVWKSEWRWRKAGIHMAHLGALILLLGGMVTALQAREGFLVIPEGGVTAFVSDYHKREMLVVRDGAVLTRVPFSSLRTGDKVFLDGTGLDVRILDRCRNCGIVRREEASSSAPAPHLGMAQFMALEPIAPEPDEEINLSGVTLSLRGAGEAQDGTYIIFEAMPYPLAIDTDNGAVEIMFGKAQTMLPFAVGLESFVKETHPGIDRARHYHSDVVIYDGDVSWPVRIEMNRPLRYKGYTLFQSSYVESEDGVASVLAVVENRGWLFPYIGTGLLALGLLWHAVLMAATGRRRRRIIS